MGSKHRKKKEPTFTDSFNLRGQPYKYYEFDDSHKLPVPAGRCCRCNKITDSFCDTCNKWFCEKHLIKTDEEGGSICKKCSEQKSDGSKNKDSPAGVL